MIASANKMQLGNKFDATIAIKTNSAKTLQLEHKYSFFVSMEQSQM